MTITEKKVPVREIVQGYFEDTATSRVTAWGGRLDVRPEYQREYVYGVGQRDAVINTVLQGFPLNIMYFVRRPDDTYEVLDGQQRIISLCQYAQNQFSVSIPSKTLPGKFDSVNYPNLFAEQARAFDEYELQIYICEGTEQEKIDWFQVINIAGMPLEKQEILNAVLHSAWLTDAKSAFSRKNCAAYRFYGKYLNGDCIRQKFLETAFRWAADSEHITGKNAVADYMRAHRQDTSADALWKYFEDVFKWVQTNFGKYDKSMKGVEWGLLYNAHHNENLDPAWLQRRAATLLADSEVQKKSGIYEYLLTGNEKTMNLRQFGEDERQTLYHRQNGRCACCGALFDYKDMHADHIVPWSKGGRTTLENGQMLCAKCNWEKSNKLIG